MLDQKSECALCLIHLNYLGFGFHTLKVIKMSKNDNDANTCPLLEKPRMTDVKAFGTWVWDLGCREPMPAPGVPPGAHCEPDRRRGFRTGGSGQPGAPKGKQRGPEKTEKGAK